MEAKKIMVVDDNKDIVTTVKTLLESKGYTVNTANNGEQFLQLIGEVQPRLVLLDVMMPGLTTREILQKLKDEGYEKTKIILVTVIRFSKEEVEAIMKEFNVVDYITKPFDITDLNARVRQHTAGSN